MEEKVKERTCASSSILPLKEQQEKKLGSDRAFAKQLLEEEKQAANNVGTELIDGNHSSIESEGDDNDEQ